MERTEQQQLIAALLARHGRTYAEELSIDLRRGGHAALFRLLVAAILMSARIRSNIAVEAARAIAKRGWRTPQALVRAPWAERAKTLNRAGYARYDERTARMLGESAQLLLDRWGGDLRRLREEAGRDPRQERRLLKAFKGLGDVGVDIFFREAQAVWPELAPFADRRALDSASRLGLGRDAKTLLARLVPPRDFPRLVAALVRVKLTNDYRGVKEKAAA